MHLWYNFLLKSVEACCNVRKDFNKKLIELQQFNFICLPNIQKNNSIKMYSSFLTVGALNFPVIIMCAFKYLFSNNNIVVKEKRKIYSVAFIFMSGKAVKNKKFHPM